MQRSVRRILTIAACCGLVLMFSGAGLAQYYTAAYLTANTTGKAKHTDALLANPRGLAYGPSAPFWVSDEASGWSTLYDGSGTRRACK
jgi:hypothetical protein